MKADVIKFGRHNPPHAGHVVVRFRHGYPSKYRNKRIAVKFNNGHWLSENGDDYTLQIEYIERMKQIKKLENHLCGK